MAILRGQVEAVPRHDLPELVVGVVVAVHDELLLPGRLLPLGRRPLWARLFHRI